MRLRKNKGTYKLPKDFGHVESVIIGNAERAEYTYLLLQVSQREMETFKDVSQLGRPHYYCTFFNKDWFIGLYPIPDSAQQLAIEYHPALKRI